MAKWVAASAEEVDDVEEGMAISRIENIVRSRWFDKPMFERFGKEAWRLEHSGLKPTEVEAELYELADAFGVLEAVRCHVKHLEGRAEAWRKPIHDERAARSYRRNWPRPLHKELSD